MNKSAEIANQIATADGDPMVPSAESYEKWIALPFLLFSGFFFVKFIFVRPPAWEIAVTAAAYGFFLLVYWRAYLNYTQPRRLRLPVALFASLGIALTPLNFGANVFFGYAAWFAGRAFGVRAAMLVIFALCVAVISLTLLLALPVNYYMPGLLVTVALGLISTLGSHSESASRALAKSREEAEHLATIAERERIARDLHDTVGHALSVVALKSELASRLVANDPVKAEEEMLAVQQVAREALAEVRETVTGYRQLGLEKELIGLVSTLEQSGLEVRQDITKAPLTPRMETVVALFFREAVTNVIRHSRAGRCVLSLAADESALIAEVSDDGIGVGDTTGFGLLGMQERAAKLGGKVAITQNGGTRVRLDLPLAPRE